MSTRTLKDILEGSKVWIKAVTAPGELGQRLRDMGLVPGTEVEVLGHAPLGDPIAIRLLGFTLSLRQSEAEHLQVSPHNEKVCCNSQTTKPSDNKTSDCEGASCSCQKP